MFRIDRRFVRISGSRAVHTPQQGAKDEQEDEGGLDGGGQDGELDIDLEGVFDPGAGIGFGDGFDFDEIASELGAEPDASYEPGFPDGTAVSAFEKEKEAEISAAEREKAAAAEKEKAEAEARDIARMFMTAAEEELEARTEEVMREAHEKAASIKAEAEEQAAAMKREAEEETEKLRKNGYDEGFEEGRKEGLAKGEEEARRNYEEALAKKIAEDDEMMNHVIEELGRGIEHVETDKEEIAVALAIDIVRKIFKPAQEELDTVFISLIKNAIQQMSSENKFTIRVSSAEYERFFSSGAAAIELDSGVTVTASVIRDVELGEGDLIIDTEDVTVNAGVESQLQYVELAFERANQFEPEVEIV